jgi:hypothetical protein
MNLKKELSLRGILDREDFKRELERAAQISLATGGEAYFDTYLTAAHEIKVNRAMRGIKRLNFLNEGIPPEELTEEHYDHISGTSTNPDCSNDMPGEGCYIEKFGRSLILLHFHPPCVTAISPPTDVIPSPPDLGVLNDARLQNNNLTDLLDSHEEQYLDNINPLSIIGKVASDSPLGYHLFVSQERPRKPVDFYGFLSRMAWRINRRCGKYYPGEVYQIVGFGGFYTLAEDFCSDLNSVGMHTAQVVSLKPEDSSRINVSEEFQKRFVYREHWH